MIELVCHYVPCSKTYLTVPAKFYRSKYCSVTCRNLARNASVEIVCAYCGKTITVTASRAERTKYCSLECKNDAGLERVEVTCAYPYCGRTFTAKASSNRKYCDKECFALDRTRPIKPLGMTDLERSKVEALIIQYERMVRLIAYRWYNTLRPRCMTEEDFIQEGYIGLITAIQNDDEPERSFTGFAYSHIRNAIIAEWRKQDHMIRLPESRMRKEAMSPEAFQQLRDDTSYCSLDYVEQKKGTQDLSTHKVRRAFDATSPVEEDALKRERYKQLDYIIKGVEPRHQRMIIDHYGLSGAQEKPLKHIAELLNIPVVTNHREFHKALELIKRRMNEWERATPCEEYLKLLTTTYQGFH